MFQVSILNSQERGATFLEAIVAISVLVIGIIAVLQISPLALSVEKASQMKTQAILLAQEKIEEKAFLSYQDVICGSEVEDALSLPFDKFSRETEIDYVDQNLVATTSDLGLKKIEVVVSWRSPLKPEENNVTVTTLIAEK